MKVLTEYGIILQKSRSLVIKGSQLGYNMIILVIRVKSFSDIGLRVSNELESFNANQVPSNLFKPNDSLANNEDLDDVDLSAIGDEVLAEGTVDASTGGVQVKSLNSRENATYEVE